MCKYKHLNQCFHMAHFCMKVDDIKHVMIALLEHFSRCLKLYHSCPSNVIHIMDIAVRKHVTGAASKIQIKQAPHSIIIMLFAVCSYAPS